MLIYVIRHGQTDWNAERRLQGQKDIPLNAVGRAQAEANGVLLASILSSDHATFDFVASPMGRTRETMEIVRRAMGLDPLAYTTDERLIEVSFGDWEGSTLKELKVSQKSGVAERARSKWDFIPPGEDAESYEILSWRTGSWLKSVERPTVCVSHGGVIRTFFRMIGQVPGEDAAEGGIPQDRILRIDRDAGEIGWL